MNKKSLITICTAVFLAAVSCKVRTVTEWSPVGDKIMTPWAENLDPSNVHSQYPRPQMVRADWMNLNGIWKLDIADGDTDGGNVYSGNILVPFPVESALSGVGTSVGGECEMTYTRTFKIPRSWRGRRVLANFGAVDWQARVFVNGTPIGEHKGGYTPFSFDITDALKSGENTLVVKVWDPTDENWQPRGKQVNKPGGIWYTPVSGIWQTVWLEPVEAAHITALRITPDVDANTLSVDALLNGGTGTVAVKVLDGGREMARGEGPAGTAVSIGMPADVKLWSPDSPFLYDLKVEVRGEDGKLLDKVESYAGMRKISTVRDASGHLRMALNNKQLFHMGPLDQGWWPDGLYTAPSDEALRYDVEKTKDLGFNMIRKHVKVEPARWYYHCDVLGVLVWQDMPSGGENPGWQMRDWYDGDDTNIRTAESEANYRREWRDIMDALYSYPSIVVWVPFNEAWGQFKTVEIAEWTKRHDPARLVNAASGGNHFRGAGDIHDLHEYPAPDLYLYDDSRVNVLGEYGGIGYPVEGHLWVPDRNWGYVRYDSSGKVTDEYVKFAGQLLDLVRDGFSAGVYTQTTDVESEVNGLLTYDRKLMKVDEARVREINRTLCRSLDDGR